MENFYEFFDYCLSFYGVGGLYPENKRTKEHNNKRLKEQENKRTKEQKNKRTKEQKSKIIEV